MPKRDCRCEDGIPFAWVWVLPRRLASYFRTMRLSFSIPFWFVSVNELGAWILITHEHRKSECTECLVSYVASKPTSARYVARSSGLCQRTCGFNLAIPDVE